jgi:hypothetical protein
MVFEKTFPNILIFALVLLLFDAASGIPVYSQLTPSYSFISFDKSYSDLMNTARSEGYQIKEDEINSSYGKYSLLIEKPLSFYLERIYLFFDDEKQLILFSVSYTINENQSKAVLDKLVFSITEKLQEKYGPNENVTLAYYKLYENKFELVVKPRQSSSSRADITFKSIDGYSQYQDYYTEEVERLENEEIAETVDKF